MRGFLIGLALAMATVPALAHGDAAWIQEGNFRSPIDGSFCCGRADCEMVPEAEVTSAPGGYLVFGREFVPHQEVQPSRDGGFWRCHYPSGERRCFFGPPMGS